MRFLKPKKFLQEFTNSRGQAIIEYLFTLIVTIGIIFGILYQFSNAFQTFASNYFGEYVKCLIQEGELPKLEVKQTDGVPTVCEQAFQPFTFTEGRPPRNDGNGQNAGNNNQASQNDRDQRFKDGRPKRRTQAGGGSGSGSGRSGGGPPSLSSNRSRGSVGNSNKNRNKKDKQIIVEGAGDSGYRGSKNNKKNNLTQLRGKNKNVVARYSIKDDSQEQNKQKVKANTKKVAEDNSITPKKSFRMTASQKSSEIKIDDTQWNFGDFIRYLLIAAILIVLVFVLGSQIVTAKKSQD